MPLTTASIVQAIRVSVAGDGEVTWRDNGGVTSVELTDPVNDEYTVTLADPIPVTDALIFTAGRGESPEGGTFGVENAWIVDSTTVRFRLPGVVGTVWTVALLLVVLP